jgi:hypothetical protein
VYQALGMGHSDMARVRSCRCVFLAASAAKDPPVAIDDARFEGWETVSTYEDQSTAVAWRDELRALGVDAACVADHPLDRRGRGDIYLVVAPSQWSRANEILHVRRRSRGLGA